MNTVELVKEFHETFEHPIIALGEAETLKNRQLRIKLLFEEVHELAEASDVRKTFLNLCKNVADFDHDAEGNVLVDGDNVDKVEELDALCDIQYVLDGKKLTSGLAVVFEQGFKQIHENNMKKAHSSIQHAKDSINFWEKNEVRKKDWKIQARGTAFLLFNPDHKLTKPHDHKKVTLQNLIP